MNAAKSLEKAQLFSAIYDYIAAGIFALPVVVAWYLNTMMFSTHEMLGSMGQYPHFDPFHLLFANLFGGFVIMWSTLRIILRLPIFGLCDGLLRCYFAIIMLCSVMLWESTALLYLFVGFELFWGSMQLYFYHKLRKQRNMSFVFEPA